MNRYPLDRFCLVALLLLAPNALARGGSLFGLGSDPFPEAPGSIEAPVPEVTEPEEGLDADASFAMLGRALAEAQLAAEVCRIARDDYPTIRDRLIRRARQRITRREPWIVPSYKAVWPVPSDQKIQNLEWISETFDEPKRQVGKTHEWEVTIFVKVEYEVLRLRPWTGWRNSDGDKTYPTGWEKTSQEFRTIVQASDHEARVLALGR